jgi:integrase
MRAAVESDDCEFHSVSPDKVTVGAWIDQWIKAGAPGRRREKVSQRTLERYEELLNTHVKPTLGGCPLQQLQPQEIDDLYSGMADAAAIAPQTQHHVHVVFSATRKGLLAANPMLRVEQVPSVKAAPVATPSDPDSLDDDADQNDIGEGLSEAELAALIDGFSLCCSGCGKSTSGFPPAFPTGPTSTYR